MSLFRISVFPSLLALLPFLAGACAPASSPPLSPLSLAELYAAAGPGVLEPDEALDSVWRKVVVEGWNGRYPELDRFLDENAQTLALLHERMGAAEDLSAIESAGHEPGLFEGLQVARLLLLEGRRHQRAGRDDDAMASVLTALCFAHRHLHEREAPLIVGMVGQGLQREALNSIRALVHRSRVSDEAWKNCLHELAVLRDAWPDLEPSMRSDSAVTRALLEEDFARKGILDDPEWRHVLEVFDVVTEEYTRKFLAAYRAGRPEDLRQHLEERERELKNPASLLATLESDPQQVRLSVEIVVLVSYSSFASTIEADMINRMLLDMDRVAVAVRLSWFDRGGKPPESLDELVPEYLEQIPEDLFAPGRPLQLARKDEQWWLYSVGPDRTDDGGRVRYSPRAPEAGGDVLSIPERRGAHRN